MSFLLLFFIPNIRLNLELVYVIIRRNAGHCTTSKSPFTDFRNTNLSRMQYFRLSEYNYMSQSQACVFHFRYILYNKSCTPKELCFKRSWEIPVSRGANWPFRNCARDLVIARLTVHHGAVLGDAIKTRRQKQTVMHCQRRYSHASSTTSEGRIPA